MLEFGLVGSGQVFGVRVSVGGSGKCGVSGKGWGSNKTVRAREIWANVRLCVCSDGVCLVGRLRQVDAEWATTGLRQKASAQFAR